MNRAVGRLARRSIPDRAGGSRWGAPGFLEAVQPIGQMQQFLSGRRAISGAERVGIAGWPANTEQLFPSTGAG
jgi:hypothetical protein